MPGEVFGVQSRARVLGQQLNPLLTVLPLGMLASAVLCDLAALISGVRFFGRVAYWDMAGGLVVGLVALCALLIDLVTTLPDTPARRVLSTASATACGMVVLFAVVWSVRSDGDLAGNAGLFLLEVLALAGGIAGTWYARALVAGQGAPEPSSVAAFWPSAPTRPTLPLPLPPASPLMLRRTVRLPRPVTSYVPGQIWSAQAGAAASRETFGAGAAARAAQASSSASLRESPSLPS